MVASAQYDAFAQDFSQSRAHAWPEFILVEDALRQIQKEKKTQKIQLLDLGCGNGRLYQYIPSDLKSHIEYIGADISSGMLAQAQQKYPEASFVKQDFSQKWQWAPGSFDIIVSIAAFHHLLDHPSQNFFLQEAHRVLSKKGKIFLTTWIFPEKHFWPNFWSGRVFTKNWNIPFGKEKHPRTYRQVTDNDLCRLFEKNNFEIKYSTDFKRRNYIALGEKVV